ncbi:MAG: MFS transporter [Acholeplasmataceae bacterium]
MKRVSKRIMWTFAIGQLGWSILAGIITNWLVYFYQVDDELLDLGHHVYVSQGTVVLGVFTITGVITAFGRIFDAFTDPLIASWSDRSHSPRGRRIPFMRIAAFPFAFFTVMVFVSPTPSVGLANNAWLFFSVILFYFFMTLYCTPYNALIPELGRNQNDKINISTFISVTFIIGTAFAYGAPFIWDTLISAGIERMSAIRMTFIGLSALALLFMLIPAFLIRERDYVRYVPSESKAFESLLKTFRNRDFRIFVASDILYWIALTLFQIGLPFFIVSLLELEESMISLLFIVVTMTSFLFYFPVNLISKRIGKKRMVIYAFLMFAFAFVVAAFSGLVPGSNLVYGFIIAVLAAMPMAILGILPQAIVADIAQYDSIVTRENREGMFFAARTFAFKLGQSLSLLLFTSVATIRTEIGLGYRIALMLAIAFSVAGAVILTAYDEKKVLTGIGKSDVIEG